MPRQFAEAREVIGDLPRPAKWSEKFAEASEVDGEFAEAGEVVGDFAEASEVV